MPPEELEQVAVSLVYSSAKMMGLPEGIDLQER
jgi:hypothetical protein